MLTSGKTFTTHRFGGLSYRVHDQATVFAGATALGFILKGHSSGKVTDITFGCNRAYAGGPTDLTDLVSMRVIAWRGVLEIDPDDLGITSDSGLPEGEILIDQFVGEFGLHQILLHECAISFSKSEPLSIIALEPILVVRDAVNPGVTKGDIFFGAVSYSLSVHGFACDE